MGVIVSPLGFRRTQALKLLLAGDALADASPNARTLYIGNSPVVASVAGMGYLPAAFTSAVGFSLGTQTSQYLYANPHADFDFGFDDFTIDWWEYRLSNHNGGGVFSLRHTVQFANMACFLDTGGLIFCCSNSGTSWDAVYNLVLGSLEYNVPNHYAIMRKDKVLYGYKNGTLNSSLSANVAIGSASYNFSIGSFWNNYYYFNGYMANFRMIRSAIWPTYGFTPPQNPT